MKKSLTFLIPLNHEITVLRFRTIISTLALELLITIIFRSTARKRDIPPAVLSVMNRTHYSQQSQDPRAMKNRQ